MNPMPIDFVGRSWWSFLPRLTPGAQQQFNIAAHRAGQISDWQLWDVLSSDHSGVSFTTATRIYQLLGYLPFAGFPLTPNIGED